MTRFQLSALSVGKESELTDSHGHAVSSIAIGRDDGSVRDLRALEALKTLEELAANVLRESPDIVWSHHRVWWGKDAEGNRVHNDEATEIDFLALPYADSGGAVVFGEFKCNASRISGSELDRNIEGFTHLLPRNVNEVTRVLHASDRRKMLVSTSLTEGQRKYHEGNGFECMGITDMARMMLEPGLERDPI